MDAQPFAYKSADLQQARQRWETVQLEPVQRAIVEDIARVVGPKIGMEEVPCRGFWLIAIVKWQTEHKLPASAISERPPEERIRHASEIRDNFRAIVEKTLFDPQKLSQLKVGI